MQIAETAVIALLALLLVASLILWFLYRQRRTAALRDRFGSEEYERTLRKHGARTSAEAALREREERVRSIDVRPLGPADRTRFSNAWNDRKTQFVDDPAMAVLNADRLLGEVMRARGFPVGDFDERYDALTVDHGEVARHYRAGHDLALKQERGEAGTEDLRQAMIHYEALFRELVDYTGVPEGAVSSVGQGRD